MRLENIPDECLEAFFREFDTTEERVEEDAKLLEQWFNQQPHLPKCLEKNDAVFKIILMRCKCSIERSKKVLDKMFTVRTALPYFSNTDPMRREFQDNMEIFNFITCPKVTKDGYRVQLTYHTDSKDFYKISMQDTFKLVWLSEDIKLRIHKALTIGEVYVSDYRHFSMGHLRKVRLSYIKEYFVVLQGYALRIKGIHFINYPPFIGIIARMLKAVMSTKIASRMHFHSSLESLHEHVDPSVLPLEYGGTAGKYSDMADQWKREIESHRDWFMEQEVIGKVDESKRPIT